MGGSVLSLVTLVFLEIFLWSRIRQAMQCILNSPCRELWLQALNLLRYPAA